MRRTARRLTTVTSLAVAGVLGAAVAAAPAFAHAKVVSTSPADGATVTGAVRRIVIRFDDVVTLVPHALTVTTDMGRPVNVESPRVVGGRTLEAIVQDHLAAGRYAVGWRIMADDGHIESSSFTFSVASAAGTLRPGAGADPPMPPPPGEPIWPVLVAAGIAVAAGLGAGLAVRRGLRLVPAGPSYPVEPGPKITDGRKAGDAMLRLPM